MRKLMQAIAAIIVVFVGLLYYYVAVALDHQAWLTIERTSSAFTVVVDREPSDLEEFARTLQRVASELDADVVRTDVYVIEEGSRIVKGVVSGSSSSLIRSLSLVSGKMPNSLDGGRFLSTAADGDNLQVGRLFDLFGDDVVEIRGMRDWLSARGSAVGDYWFVPASGAKVTADVHSAIAAQIGGVDPGAKNPLGTQGAQGDSVAVVLFPVLIVFSVALLTYVSLFYFYSRVKTIGIMKLQGWRNRHIWWDLAGPAMGAGVVSAAVFNVVFSAIFFGHVTRTFILGLLGVQALALLLVILSCLLVLLLTIRQRVSSILNGRYRIKLISLAGYGFKLVFVLALAAICVNLSQNFISAELRKNDLATWNAHGDYRTIITFSIGDDEQSLRNSSSRFRDDMQGFFWDANKSIGALYIDTVGDLNASIFPADTSPGGQGWFRSEDVPTDFRRQALTVSPNYLGLMGITDPSGAAINVAVDDPAVIALLPETRRAEAVAAKALLEADWLRDQVNGLEAQGKKISSLAEVPKPEVKIGFYRAERPLFTFKWGEGLVDNFYLEAPVIRVITTSNYTMPAAVTRLDTPMKFPAMAEADFQAAVDPLLAKHHLLDNKLRFMQIKDYLGEENAEIAVMISGLTLAVVTMIVLCLVTSRFLIVAIVQSRRQELFIRRFLGYPLWDRYRALVASHAAIYAAGYLLMAVLALSSTRMQDRLLARTIGDFGWFALASAAYLVAICVDAVLSARYIHRLESAGVVTGLKGRV